MNATPVETGFLKIDGKQLEYACYGTNRAIKPTFLLLHEGLGCIKLWRDFPEKLAQASQCKVVVYSRAGYGQSDPVTLPRPINYMTHEAQEVLPQVIDALSLQEVILLGHSDGATIAAIHAGTVVDRRVRGLILMAPHFFAEDITLIEIEKAKEAYQSTGLKQQLAKYHCDVDNAFYGWNDVWLHPEFKRWDVSQVINTIPVPVLAIQGCDDQYGTLAQIKMIEENCHAPVVPLVLNDCRHSPFIDQTQKVLDAAVSFQESLVS